MHRQSYSVDPFISVHAYLVVAEAVQFCAFQQFTIIANLWVGPNIRQTAKSQSLMGLCMI